MIPYFQIPSISFLGFTIHTFEILTSIGIFVGVRYTLNQAKVRSLPEKNMIDAILISLVAGFMGAHAMHVILYQQSVLHPFKILEVWKGISSTGGFLAGGLAAWIYVRSKKLSVDDFGDCMVPGLLIAQFFGRLGCFTVHDHPGSLTSFPLAVSFPGGSRHDLGLYEALLILDFLIIVHIPQIKSKINQVRGQWMTLGLLFYGSIRFFLDFLRAKDLPESDTRYFGLTPAQYVCLFFVFLAIYRLNVSKTKIRPA